MHTLPIHTNPQDAHESLKPAQKSILIVAAALSLGALITHHPGMVVFIAVATSLVKVAIQRITGAQVAGTAAHVSGGLTCRRVNDGGTFSGAEENNGSSRSQQAVVVMDGGSR